MTDYSLNKQFKNLVQKKLQEQDSNSNINNNQEMKQNNNNNDNSVSAKSPDFFQGNNAIKKKRKANLKLYTTSRVKTRNYLLRFLQQKF